jgi:nucleotide-binding universal stress UspA family protein
MKVLIAVDSNIQPDSIADFVRRHVWEFPCDFKVIHVVRPIQDGDIVGLLKVTLRKDIADERLSSGRHLVRRVAIALRDALHTTHVEEEVLEGDARDMIVKCAREWQADLVVVSSHINASMRRRLGSVSAAVAADAPCSVLLIRGKESAEPIRQPDRIIVRRVVSG